MFEDLSPFPLPSRKRFSGEIELNRISLSTANNWKSSKTLKALDYYFRLIWFDVISLVFDFERLTLLASYRHISFSSYFYSKSRWNSRAIHWGDIFHRWFYELLWSSFFRNSTNVVYESHRQLLSTSFARPFLSQFSEDHNFPSDLALEKFLNLPPYSMLKFQNFSPIVVVVVNTKSWKEIYLLLLFRFLYFAISYFDGEFLFQPLSCSTPRVDFLEDCAGANARQLSFEVILAG